MDDRLFLVQTSREVAKKLKEKEKEAQTEQSAGGTVGEGKVLYSVIAPYQLPERCSPVENLRHDVSSCIHSFSFWFKNGIKLFSP